MRFPLLLSFIFSGLAATAGGFETGPQGARLLGLGGASTAYVGSIAGLGTNPGLLGQWADSLTRVSVGGLGQVRRSAFVSQDTYQRTNQDLTVQPGGYLYATHGLTKRVAIGLAISTPYGYHTRWPDNWQGRSVVRESQLNTYSVQPTVGFHFNDNFSAGLGVIYAFSKYSQRHALGQYDNLATEVSYSGSGGGVGLTAGIYGRSGDNLAFGISFRSPITQKITNGAVTYANIPATDASLYPASSSFASELILPTAISVGLADRITKKLLLTFDFTLTGWSVVDSLNFEVAASGNVPAKRVATGRRYEDAMSFRVGAEYQVSPQLTVLGGAHYDETPVRDEYINPEFADSNRLGASLGLVYQFSSHFALEGAYSYGYGQLRTARANQTKEQISNISGTYRTAVHTAALGLAVSF